MTKKSPRNHRQQVQRILRDLVRKGVVQTEDGRFVLVKKGVTVVCLLAIMAMNARALIPVHDAISTVQNEINSVKAYILQGYQYVKDGETAINTNLTALRELQQCENEILALERLGNPKMLITLPGISNIVTLEQIVSQFQQDVNDLTALADPANAKISVQQILARYGITGFTGATSGWGVRTTIPTGIIQFSQSSYGVAQAAQDKIQTLNTQKQTLTTQRDQAIASEASATDTETRTRYHNQVMSLSAAIADVNASINQEIQLNNLQQQQILAAQGLYQTSNALQAAANFQQDQENGVNSMTGVQGGTPQVASNLQASDYGYVGDLTPDTNSANGIGNHDNQLIPYSNPGQVASAALSSNVASQYNLSVGQQFQFTTSNGTTYQLQYDDSTSSKLANRVDIYAPNGQLGGNNFSAQGATISVGLPSKVQ